MNHKNTASVAVKITLVAGALLKVQTKKVSCNLERERDRHVEKELISNSRRSTAILVGKAHILQTVQSRRWNPAKDPRNDGIFPLY